MNTEETVNQYKTGPQTANEFRKLYLGLVLNSPGEIYVPDELKRRGFEPINVGITTTCIELVAKEIAAGKTCLVNGSFDVMVQTENLSDEQRESVVTV